MDKLLKLLDENARLTNAQLASMLGTSEQDVANKIKELEKDGVIRGYKPSSTGRRRAGNASPP